MLIFLDTEFTDLIPGNRLISIGAVSEDGREFYAELSDTYSVAQCNEFVKKEVLPKLEGGKARSSEMELALSFGNWLEDFSPERVKIVTDSRDWDWPWIASLFSTPGTWPTNLSKTPRFCRLPKTSSMIRDNGQWRHHHALDDAKVARLAYLFHESDGLEDGTVASTLFRQQTK